MTVPHGVVRHLTSPPHKTENKMKGKKKTLWMVITFMISSMLEIVPCSLDVFIKLHEGITVASFTGFIG